MAKPTAAAKKANTSSAVNAMKSSRPGLALASGPGSGSTPVAAAAAATVSATNALGDVKSAFETTLADYKKTLTPRLMVIDIFLAFLVALGALQFIYVILIGNFPFNAFLGGFISCVGQFVLAMSLRLQIKASQPTLGGTPSKLQFNLSPERAFGDFIFASLILHFIVYHFIN